MPERSQIVDFDVSPESSMKNGDWAFARSAGRLGRLLHKYGSIVYSWTEDRERFIDIPVVFSEFIDRNQRNLDINILGALSELDNAASVGPVTPAEDFTVSAKGIGKLFISINGGADTTGSITITGTSVDRDTQAQSGGDTEVLTIAGLTTDDSDVDGGGHPRHKFTDGYLSSKWWTGVVVLSSDTVEINDMDIFHVSFEQFNDAPSMTLNTFDINTFPTNASAELYAYLYMVKPTSGSKCNITREASLTITTAVANEYTRLRQGKIGTKFNGVKAGIFLDVFFDPTPQTYFSDVSIKVWATERVRL